VHGQFGALIGGQGSVLWTINEAVCTRFVLANGHIVIGLFLSGEIVSERTFSNVDDAAAYVATLRAEDER
jgi:hypothetical protein